MGMEHQFLEGGINPPLEQNQMRKDIPEEEGTAK